MTRPRRRPAPLPARGGPLHGLLAWLPLALLATGPGSGAAGVGWRLAALLVTAGAVWGSGRGPAGRRAELAFLAVSLVAWFGVVGAGLAELGPPAHAGSRLALAAAMLSGPAVLMAAWLRRQGMARVPPQRPAAGRGSPLAALAPAVTFVAVVLLVGWLRRFGTAELLQIAAGVVLFAVLRERGRVAYPLGQWLGAGWRA